MEHKRKPWPNFWTPRDMVRHPAFISLTGKAAHVLMILRTKLQTEKVGRPGHLVWTIVNNGLIRFPYAEARKCGMSNFQFRAAIDQLLDRGFIQVAQAGGQHKPTLFRITDNWRQWQPGQHCAIREPDRRAHKLHAAATARAHAQAPNPGGSPG